MPASIEQIEERSATQDERTRTPALERARTRRVVASPRRPQTLGKVERFWGTLWRECLETSVFLDMGDAQKRIGLFIDYYNFQRPHQGLESLVPADRFFGAAPDVLRTLKERVTANALELARNGAPKTPSISPVRWVAKASAFMRRGSA